MRLARYFGVGALLYSLLALNLPAAAPVQRPRPSTQRVQSGGVQYGLASWYGRHWRGRKTESGAFFDNRALTAAHRTLPLGSKVQVTNLKTGRSVVVKITDRGPHVRRRVIDLSRAAAIRLGFTHRGIAPVKVQLVKNQGAADPALVPERSTAAPAQR